MLSTVLNSLVGLSCLSAVSAAPFSFPLSNGFPNVANPSPQLTTIEDQAHGSLPNAPPPPTIQPDSITSLQLVAFNELSEVAFFTELLLNITNNVEGYQIKDSGSRQTILTTLIAVQAQEELHTLNANGALANFGVQPIQPCKYNFPVNTFDQAIALAATFTDVVLGTLQEVQTIFGQDGDVGLIQGVGSVIGQEGEQNGFYRTLLGKIPSALPFLTTSTREFAFSALNQMFIVPGSCPNIETIDLPIFQPLAVDTVNIQPVVQNLEFSITLPTGNSNKTESGKNGSVHSWSYQGQAFHSHDSDNLALVYINQQNLPVVEKLQNVHVEGQTFTFEALFPFDQALFGNGLTIAAVTNSSGPFATADAVAKATIFGPGLIEIN